MVSPNKEPPLLETMQTGSQSVNSVQKTIRDKNAWEEGVWGSQSFSSVDTNDLCWSNSAWLV